MINKKINTAIISSILVAGVLALLSPSLATNTYAAYGGEYQDPNVNVQTIKCINSNENINGVDITQIPDQNGVVASELQGDEAATGEPNGNGAAANGLNLDKNLVSICVNINDNGQFDDVLRGVVGSLGLN